MTKLTKKRIEAVAEKLRVVSGAQRPWAFSQHQEAWRRVAEFVLTEPDLRNALKKPKSCRLVRGKVVCS